MRELLLVPVFFAVSGLFSMLGLGGGILYVPLLLFAGYSMDEAPAVSLGLIALTSASALVTWWRHGKVDWRLALVIDPPTDLGAFLGGWGSGLVPEGVLLGLLVAVLAAAGWLMVKGPVEARGGARPGGRWTWRHRFAGREISVHLPLVLGATGGIGVLSGMLGITGGILKLPIMVLLCGVPMDVAVATSTVMVAATALAGLAGHALHGPLPWRAALLLGLAALAGGQAGSRWSLALDRRRLRRMFGVVLWLVAAGLLVRSLS